MGADGPGITSFTPTSGPAGTEAIITGTRFAGATLVEFVHDWATFTVDSDTQITAWVPAHAHTGAIAVTTLGGSVVSAGVFTVTTPNAAGACPAAAPERAAGPGPAVLPVVLVDRDPRADTHAYADPGAGVHAHPAPRDDRRHVGTPGDPDGGPRPRERERRHGCRRRPADPLRALD